MPMSVSPENYGTSKDYIYDYRATTIIESHASGTV